jgi:predicted aspartyl protease
MSTHNPDHDPPFPQLIINLRNSNDDRLGPFPALLDSGADVTFVPISLLEQLTSWRGEEARVRSHFGEYQIVRLYLISVQINTAQLSGLYIVGDEVGDEIILGRDILNKLPIFLDGPAQQTEVLDDATVKRLRARRKAQT